jgi:hypothetical protein
VFLADRATLDACGTGPGKQRLIPWVWCGWGTEKVWGGSPSNPPERIVPFVKGSLESLAAGMPEPWLLLPGRSNPPDRANGRVNIGLTVEAGLMPRSTLFLYEAIEYEPSIPGAVLQFADIRRMLRDEAKYAATADGVFGNAQQPVMVLPNLFFFARASADLSYLDTPDEEVLGDLADLLGGDRALLVPTWRCLELPLDKLPADLPDRLRKATLSGEAAAFIPGGPRRYLDILAAQVESRRGLLEAVATPAGDDDALIRQPDQRNLRRYRSLDRRQLRTQASLRARAGGRPRELWDERPKVPLLPRCKGMCRASSGQRRRNLSCPEGEERSSQGSRGHRPNQNAVSPLAQEQALRKQQDHELRAQSLTTQTVDAATPR